MANNELKQAFFSDLHAHISLWSEDTARALADPDSARWAETQQDIRDLSACFEDDENLDRMRRVLNEVLRGLVHSVLTIVDGGTMTAETGSLALVEADSGVPITESSLHEEFFEFLADHDLL